MSAAKKAEKVEKFEMISADIGGDETGAKKGKKAKKAAKAKTAKAKKSNAYGQDDDESLNDSFIASDDDAPKKKAKTVKKR